jgi:RinA family phage transcriptional activator
MIDDNGARALIASILKSAYDDYTKGKSCPEWCQFYNTCAEEKKNKGGTVLTPGRKVDKNQCDAREFLHSAWCATLTEGLDLDHKEYIAVCIKNHRLSKNTYRYIEGQIRDYKKIKKEMENLKEDIINSSPISQEVRGTDTGDSTSSKAIKISLDKKISGMDKTVKAIEKVYNDLSHDKKAVMTDIWERRYTDTGIADKIGVSERTVRYWRQNMIYQVAIELKYL